MTDPALAPTPAPEIIYMNTTWKVVFACLALLFFSSIIVYLIIYGHEKNSLHESALAWSFLGDMGVLAALGIGSVLEIIPQIFGKK